MENKQMITIITEDNETYIIDRNDFEDFGKYIDLHTKFKKCKKIEIKEEVKVDIKEVEIKEEVKVVEQILPIAYNLYEIKNKFKNDFTSDSEITLKNNVQTAKSFMGMLGRDHLYINDFITPENIIELVEANYPHKPTQRLKYLFVRKLYKCLDSIDNCPQEYYERIGRIKGVMDSNKTTNASEKEIHLLRFLKDNSEMLRDRIQNQIDHKETKKKWFQYQRMALFCLYMNCNTIRKGWRSFMVVKKNLPDDDETNYYNQMTREVVLKDFKTDKRYGIISFFLTDYPIALEAVDNWIDNHPFKNEKVFRMFVSKTKKDISPSNFGKLLNEVFGDKKISVNVLRKFCQYNEYKNPKSTAKSRTEMLRIMGHSANVSLEYYQKDFELLDEDVSVEVNI